MNDDDLDPTFQQWCVLELMGHRKLAGLITACEIAGKGFLRLDVFGKPEPNEKPIVTQYYNPASVYGFTPVSEITARRYAINHRPQPITRYELAALPEGALPYEVAIGEGDEDGDDDDEWRD